MFTKLHNLVAERFRSLHHFLQSTLNIIEFYMCTRQNKKKRRNEFVHYIILIQQSSFVRYNMQAFFGIHLLFFFAQHLISPEPSYISFNLLLFNFPSEIWKHILWHKEWMNEHFIHVSLCLFAERN